MIWRKRLNSTEKTQTNGQTAAQQTRPDLTPPRSQDGSVSNHSEQKHRSDVIQQSVPQPVRHSSTHHPSFTMLQDWFHSGQTFASYDRFCSGLDEALEQVNSGHLFECSCDVLLACSNACRVVYCQLLTMLFCCCTETHAVCGNPSTHPSAILKIITSLVIADEI